MGLSNEERINKMLHVIHLLVERVDRPNNKIPKPISDRLSKLYGMLLSNDGDGGFWFSGGHMAELSRGTCEHNNPISEALYNSAEQMITTNSEVFWSKAEASEGIPKRMEEIEEELSLRSMLYKQGHVNDHRDGCYDEVDISQLTEIYEWGEFYFYAVNRYQDKMSEQYKEISTLVSEVMMWCTRYLRDNPNFFKAWVFQQLYKVMLDPMKYAKDNDKDFVVRLWTEMHLESCVHIRELTDEEILKILQKIRQMENDYPGDKRRKIPMQDRLDVTLMACGHGLHERYWRRQLVGLVEHYNKRRKKNRVDLKAVHATLDGYKDIAAKHKKEKDEQNRKRYRDNVPYCSIKDYLLRESAVLNPEKD